jgi:hypothetical protein
MSPSTAQIITKTHKIAPFNGGENIDPHNESTQVKMSKKQSHTGGNDKIRPGFAADFSGGKKSRGGILKQSNIQMTGSLTLEDIRGHDAEIEQRRENQSKRSYPNNNNYMSVFSNDSRPRKCPKRENNSLTKKISKDQNENIKVSGFSKIDQRSPDAVIMTPSTSLLPQSKFMGIRNNNIKRDESVLGKIESIKEQKLMTRADK